MLLKYLVSRSQPFDVIIVKLFHVYCRLRKGSTILVLRTREKGDTKIDRGVDTVLLPLDWSHKMESWLFKK